MPITLLYNIAMKRILKDIILYIWCLPQNIAGLLAKLIYGCTSGKYGDVTVCRSEKYAPFCFSLGRYIFLSGGVEPGSRLFYHEYGHTVQSRILGPLYLFAVGIPSFVWCHLFTGFRVRRGIGYGSFYTERWADRISDKYVKLHGAIR